MEVKKIIKTKVFLEAVIVITVVLALVLPSSAVVTNKDINEEKDFFWEGKEKIEIDDALTWSQTNEPLPASLNGNIAISGWAEGDSRRPSITRDSLGNVFVTYQFDEDILSSAAGFAYNPNPLDQDAWWENGVVLSLTDIELLYYPDTALCEHPTYELMNVFVALDTEEAGGMYIPDVTNYETWEIYTWTSGAPDPELAAISDGGWYDDFHYPGEIIGPHNFYIYHEIYDIYDIPSCPIFFHNGIDAGSGIGYFDAQSFEETAPAGDPDIVNLEDRMHTSVYNKDTEKVIWKKIDPAVESDYEFTPFQATVADGTNPAIAAYGTQVAIIYHQDGQIKCVYSSNDGDTWSQPVNIGAGRYPDAYALGSTIYAAYVNNGNLYSVSSEDGGVTWSSPTKRNDQDGSVVAEENCIDVHSAGIVWVDSRTGNYNIFYTPLSSGPNPPTITGPSSGKINRNIDFTLSTDDPGGLDVSYFVDWGDGLDSGWVGPYASGEEVTLSHRFSEEETLTIRAKAKNTEDVESDWSSLPFTAPKNKVVFWNFIEKFPILRYFFDILIF